MSSEVTEVEAIEHTKRRVWRKFIVNVAMETDPEAALIEAGYGVRDVPVILRVVRRYRTSGFIA